MLNRDSKSILVDVRQTTHLSSVKGKWTADNIVLTGTCLEALLCTVESNSNFLFDILCIVHHLAICI